MADCRVNLGVVQHMVQHNKTSGNQSGPVGPCGLCREQRVLRYSHLFPAALYKILRDPDRRNPNPVMVTRSHAGTTSRQVSAYFLCGDCEQRFSRDGSGTSSISVPGEIDFLLGSPREFRAHEATQVA